MAFIVRRRRSPRWRARSSRPSRSGSSPQNFDTPFLILIYAALILGGSGSIAGAVLGGAVVEHRRSSCCATPTRRAALFYGLILLALVAKLRPWRMLAAVLGAHRRARVAAHAIAAAISASAVAGEPGAGGDRSASVLEHWLDAPAPNATTAGNIALRRRSSRAGSP